MTAVGVRFENVGVRRDGVVIVDGASARVPPGEVTALVGPNGAGKSTLIGAALGLVAHTGAVVFEPPGRPRIGYVPQRFSPDRDLPLTALEFLACAQQRRPIWLLGVRREVRERSLSLLESVKAAGTADRPLGRLSGGELQRVLLANALLQDPDLLILDEPDAGVDAAGEGLFCEILEDLRRERGFTQLMVSHNIALVMAHARHVILMNRRILAEGTPAQALATDAMQEAFGMHLLALAPHRH